ncbi:MAG: hypothetical protein HYR75_01055 [Gemmatimonadetes bacterium]|nr:hypothetical protein [Gemmatimonadota bacterium]MBI3566632.1 hypothetical protein [Gemmatimonadota bacterium]
MRLARLALLALTLGAPLRAQDVTPASTAPLTATLHFASYGDMWFDSNRPAYFAVFELSSQNLYQLYPTWGRQGQDALTTAYAPSAATYGRPNLYFAQRQIYYDRMWSYATYPGRSYLGEMHTLLLVASTRPLNIGSPLEADRLQWTLARQGHAFDLDRDSGIDALVALVTPGASDDEVAVDMMMVDPSQVWGANAYDASGATGLSLYCPGRFDSIYDWMPWEFSDYYCNPYYLNPYFPPTPAQPLPPQRTTEEMVAIPLKMKDGTNQTSDPEEIRRVMDRLREYDANRSMGMTIYTPGMGGPEGANRHAGDNSRRVFSPTGSSNSPGRSTGSTGSFGSGGAAAQGPNDNHRAMPSPSNPGGRSFRPSSPSSPSSPGAAPVSARSFEGAVSMPSPRFFSPPSSAGMGSPSSSPSGGMSPGATGGSPTVSSPSPAPASSSAGRAEPSRPSTGKP